MSLKEKPLALRRLSIKTNPQMKSVDTDSNVGASLIQQAQEKESNELVNKTLTIKDPQHGKNIVFFSYEEKMWKVDDKDPENLFIMSLENSVLQKEDKALTTYQANYHTKRILAKKKAASLRSEYGGDELNAIRSMRNQLTFSERTSQTFNPKILTKQVETEKLFRNNHSGVVHKWDIFDKYLTKYITEEDKRKHDIESKMGGNKKERIKKPTKQAESLQKPSLIKTLKLVERQIIQILNADKYHLYREWNRIEEVRDSKLLLNLLPFPQSANIKNRSVTAICWNPKYEDLFAVGYGSYAFPKKKEEKEKQDGEERSDDILENGSIYVFSVKNNYYPEMKYTTESGVLSIDFHQKQFSYLVAGMYDGTVAVFDIKQKIKIPIITCDIRLQRHMDPVWQVKWYGISEHDEFVFYSISSDGKVIRWSFFKNKSKLECEEIITLKYSESASEIAEKSQEASASVNISSLDNESKGKMDEAIIFGNAGGMCLDFNKHKGFEHLFVLGTEEGHLHLCSVKHRGHYIQSYEGHSMGVYTVTWNLFHEKVFLSCSADWTIKV
jgi:dynein intermediate chain 1